MEPIVVAASPSISPAILEAAIPKGVRGQLIIILDDADKDGDPDVMVALRANLPHFGVVKLATKPENIPLHLLDAALVAAAKKIPGSGGDVVAKLGAAFVGSIKPGQGAIAVVNIGDQDGDGGMDVQLTLDGHVFGGFPVHVNSGVHNIPLSAALADAEMFAGALPPPANAVAVGVVAGLRFIMSVMPA